MWTLRNSVAIRLIREDSAKIRGLFCSGNLINSFNQSLNFVERRVASATRTHQAFFSQSQPFSNRRSVEIAVREKQASRCESSRDFTRSNAIDGK